MALIERRRSRREVADRYGHPWPWRVRELIEKHAVEPNVDLRDPRIDALLGLQSKKESETREAREAAKEEADEVEATVPGDG